LSADENPALKPTRVWRTGGTDVAFCARALIKRLDAGGQALLRYLAEHAREGPATTTELSAATGIDHALIAATVARVNLLAGALGYLPLISESEDRLHVSAESAPVVIQGLSDAQS
jgi:hypothetical protein